MAGAAEEERGDGAGAGVEGLLSQREGTLGALMARSTVVSVLNRPHASVVTIPADASLRQALEVLSTNRILSAPVQGVKSSQWLGFVDMFDILSCLLNVCLPDSAVSAQKDASEPGEVAAMFDRTTVAEIINLSDMNPLKLVAESTPLCILLTHFAGGIHRCAVVNDDGSMLVNIISQSDVVRFVARHHHLMGPIASATLAALQLGTKAVVCVAASAPVASALLEMRDRGISAVAVVDDADARLVATLSISDLRGLDTARVADVLRMPVGAFIAGFCTDRVLPPLAVQANVTFETLLLKFAVSGLHRVWVVDSGFRPVGVVSLSDLMKVFLSLA